MTVRTIDYFNNASTGVLKDNTTGDIEPVDIRDIVDTLEDLTSQAVLTKTANYTAAVADNRRRIVFNSASAVTLTLPNNLPVGWECAVLQLGAGQVTIAVTGGSLLSRDTHNKTYGQYAQIYLWVHANAGTAPQVALSGDTAP